MTVAVHISSLDSTINVSQIFNYHCFSALAKAQPNSHFIFIFDNPSVDTEVPFPNCTIVKTGPVIRNSLLLHYWYNFKLPAILKKYSPDVFVSAGEVISQRVSCRQVIIADEYNNGAEKHQAYHKRFRKKFYAAATLLFATNEQLYYSLAKNENLSKKVHLVFHGPEKEFITLSDAKKQEIKDKYAVGHEFFLYLPEVKNDPNTNTLLKAFSIFKKWQRSNMLLMIGSSQDQQTEIPRLGSYKFRDDLIIISKKESDQMSGLLASSYAAIQIPSKPASIKTGIDVLRSNVPLITTRREFNSAIFKDAVCFAKPQEEDISKQMILLYKNEEIRMDLIEKGKKVAENYSWNNTARLVWEYLQGS
jgi:glycosyltransferase involved in cell wall biosynthesis